MSPLAKPSKLEYSHLSTSDDWSPGPEAQGSPLTRSDLEKPKYVLLTRTTLFAAAQAGLNFVWTLLLLLATVVLLSREQQEQSQEWHETDIESARPFLSRMPVKFTTGLYWNETTGDTTDRVWNKDEPIYVGSRTPALDAAWDDISLPLDLYITEDEARGIPDIPQGMYQDSKTGNYMVIVEAIHSLHCLNMLRKRIYLHDYPEMDTARLPNHVDHCIEALRMNLMCTADMTPAPLFYTPAIDKLQPNFEITHSCRDFRSLLKWARKRSAHQKYDS